MYRREVDIAVCRGEARTVFCVARSTVTVFSDDVEAAVQSGQVGGGQLFRRYNLLPEFRLLDAGRSEEVRIIVITIILIILWHVSQRICAARFPKLLLRSCVQRMFSKH